MEQVQNFYDTHAQYEWHRLERHRMELSMSMRMLNEYLPKPPCRILDIGGGPGRYAIALTQQGYDVTLLDLSAGCLEFANTKAAEAGVTLAGSIHGNALDLSAIPAASFDAVLLMGPMYHLLAQEERDLALREARRVLKPGGVAAVAFINRYANLRTRSPERVISSAPQMLEEFKTGIRRNADGSFTDAYMIHPAEVAPLLERNGFTFIEMIAAEGVRSDIDLPSINQLSDEDWAVWVDLHYRVGKDPTVHGASVHLLAIGSAV